MERLTTQQIDGSYQAPTSSVQAAGSAWQGEAIHRLAQFENYFEALRAQQADLAQKLERLRSEGKKSSVQFREMLGNKVMGSQALAMLKVYGIE